MATRSRRRTVGLGIGFVVALGITGDASAAPDDEARDLFERFVAAQNAHDAAAVERLLWDSPGFLWITRGTAIWGRAAALDRFRTLYQGTWSLAPDMAQFRAIQLADGAIQIFVPVVFTIGAFGQPAQPAGFLMNQTLRREAGIWRIASILPVPLPPS